MSALLFCSLLNLLLFLLVVANFTSLNVMSVCINELKHFALGLGAWLRSSGIPPLIFFLYNYPHQCLNSVVIFNQSG